MPMEQNGLAKLAEECGEVIQVAAKMIGYPGLQMTDQMHPDGTVLRRRLEKELGDLQAAIAFVARKMKLNGNEILAQADMKLALFEHWDKE